MSEKDDHDLLIAIANDVKWIREWSIEHEKSDIVNHTEVRNIAKAAHARMDKVFIGGILAVIILALSIYFK